MLNCEPLPTAGLPFGSANASRRAINWTPVEEAELIRLWNDGCSGGLIAHKLRLKFGFDYTRNAILGKRTRLKLPSRPTTKFLDCEASPPPAIQRPRKCKETPAKHKRPRFKDYPNYKELSERMISLHERGRTAGRIAQILGLSRSIVEWHLLEQGVLHFRGRSNRGSYYRNGAIVTPVTPEEVATFVELRIQGLTAEEIARRVGRFSATVRYWLAREAIREDGL